MRPYVLRRLALAVPTLVLVSVIVFSIMRLMPGDVVIRMVEGHAYAPTVEALRQELGLDRPAHVQYVEWVGGILLRGDFGNSYWTRQPIWDEFISRFPVTLELAVLTILSSVVSALLRRSPLTQLLGMGREGPPLHWEDAVFVLRDAELCRAAAYRPEGGSFTGWLFRMARQLAMEAGG